MIRAKKEQPLPPPEKILEFLSTQSGLVSAAQLHTHWPRCNLISFCHYLARRWRPAGKYPALSRVAGICTGARLADMGWMRCMPDRCRLRAANA
jgi:hypothetical protein